MFAYCYAFVAWFATLVKRCRRKEIQTNMKSNEQFVSGRVPDFSGELTSVQFYCLLATKTDLKKRQLH